jgi:hypothetical protein
MFLSNRLTNLIAFFLLLLMFFLSFFSMIQNSLTFDEKAHIGAGFSYLVKKDYRLNPEHPPLIKDISALPLLFLNLNFPDNNPAWLQEKEAPAWWVQFDFGNQFLYWAGNNPRIIILWTRTMMIFILLFLGWLLFWWLKKKAGNKIALLTLFLFVFSPIFLAHGQLVTTDVGAALGAVLAIIFWLEFLHQPNWGNILKAGFFFGLSQLLKFTLLILIPFFFIITLLYLFIFKREKIFLSLKEYLGKSLLIGIVGFCFVIWPVYYFHIFNYPIEHQLRDTKADIVNNPLSFAKKMTIWMTEKNFLRAPAQYFRGVLMAFQRSAWGNNTYFLGEISAKGWWYYFPTLYFFKTPLSFHLLTLLALFVFLISLFQKKLNINKENFWILAIFIWITLYWLVALQSKLNIGIRHLIPVLPFTFILVVLGINQIFQMIRNLQLRKILFFFLFICFSWYAFSTLLIFPHYLSYYNEITPLFVPKIDIAELKEKTGLFSFFWEGTRQGYKIAVDSNYDWGQDFYRLFLFVQENNIDKIYLDYFGGEESNYWLKEKYLSFDPKKDGKPKGWLAVSVNQLMGGLAKPTREFDQETGYYQWLRKEKPVTRLGYSIFLYYFD